ncbi:diguanylate cyclase [Alteromonas confluentis]|uniref:diguanylate cyclase n=1 Tax=Alteromonas confluentis TaxID=1656094 RepID=A0A1E7ZG50_9ALTE|nr:diguanylate cyclase [Alteromonas confluentis]OFC72498.1 diguanylate cyclase response regulator [Alteromonas confluentis]
MFKILVVEDSQIVRKILNKLVEDNPHFQSVLCADYAQAKAKIESDEEYLAAIVDLNLPDAPRGEIVELMLSHNVPTAVLTGNFDETLRNVLIDKGVLDYITKESRYSYMQVIKLIDRLRKNLTTKVLVVDDSTTSNSYLCAFLRKFRFQVMSAFDGVEALKILRENPDIKLVISDYMMPNMDGFELVKAVRQDRAFQDLVFIGLSANGNSMLSAKFIKSGANDFLSKPFYHEEFFCRVLQNLEAQEMLETIREAASLDSLTNTYNRRYLFEHGEALFRQAKGEVGLSVAMLDVDDFKSVNDTYGHKVGDQLLQEFASLMGDYFGDDLYGRYGGEEFSVMSTRQYHLFIEDINKFVAAVRNHEFTEHRLKLTCSIGICSEEQETLDQLVDIADARMYNAKRSGKDQVIEMD